MVERNGTKNGCSSCSNHKGASTKARSTRPTCCVAATVKARRSGIRPLSSAAPCAGKPSRPSRNSSKSLFALPWTCPRPFVPRWPAFSSTRPSAHEPLGRDVVCAMAAPLILAPHTKLATTRWWQTTTFAEELFCDGSRRGQSLRGDGLARRASANDREEARRALSRRGSLVLYHVS